jgi:hypothetical protein
MRPHRKIKIWTTLISLLLLVRASLGMTPLTALTKAASTQMCDSLEEISKLAAIAYCGSITPPFVCNSYCDEFPQANLIRVQPSDDQLVVIHDFELV